MSKIQEIFVKMQDAKKQQRDIRAMIKDALASSSGYKEMEEQMKDLRIKKRTIEQNIKSQFTRELEKLDELTLSMKEDIAALADVVLTMLAKGEIIKVRDAYNGVYDPVIKVNFKKSDDQENS